MFVAIFLIITWLTLCVSVTLTTHWRTWQHTGRINGLLRENFASMITSPPAPIFFLKSGVLWFYQMSIKNKIMSLMFGLSPSDWSRCWRVVPDARRRSCASRRGGAAPESPRRRTSVWKRTVWSWREEAGAHAKKNPNSAMWVSALVF